MALESARIRPVSWSTRVGTTSGSNPSESTDDCPVNELTGRCLAAASDRNRSRTYCGQQFASCGGRIVNSLEPKVTPLYISVPRTVCEQTENTKATSSNRGSTVVSLRRRQIGREHGR